MKLRIPEGWCKIVQQKREQQRLHTLTMTRQDHSRILHIQKQMGLMSQQRTRLVLKSVFLVMELGISEEFVKVVLAMREQRRLDMLVWVLLWMSPGIQTVAPLSISTCRETKRGSPSSADPDSTVDVSGTRNEQDIGERWLAGEYVTDILGDLTSERHVEEGEGSALGASETDLDATDEESSGLIVLLLFLETLTNLPQSFPDESETSVKEPTDGTGPDIRRSGGQTDLGKRTHVAKSNSLSQGGGKKGKKANPDVPVPGGRGHADGSEHISTNGNQPLRDLREAFIECVRDQTRQDTCPKMESLEAFV